MPKKKKTFASEFIRQTCVVPANKEKNKALKSNRPNDARLAAITEVNCKIAEESFKT